MSFQIMENRRRDNYLINKLSPKRLKNLLMFEFGNKWLNPRKVGNSNFTFNNRIVITANYQKCFLWKTKCTFFNAKNGSIKRFDHIHKFGNTVKFLLIIKVNLINKNV